MNPQGGYTGKLLRVDLTTGKLWESDEHLQFARDFIGGRGLGARLLWDLLPAGSDPLAPPSPLILLTGPLTGIAPGARKKRNARPIAPMSLPCFTPPIGCLLVAGRGL